MFSYLSVKVPNAGRQPRAPVAFAEAADHMAGLVVEHDHAVEDGAGVFPLVGLLAEPSVVHGDGESGVVDLVLAGAVLRVGGEVCPRS